MCVENHQQSGIVRDDIAVVGGTAIEWVTAGIKGGDILRWFGKAFFALLPPFLVTGPALALAVTVGHEPFDNRVQLRLSMLIRPCRRDVFVDTLGGCRGVLVAHAEYDASVWKTPFLRGKMGREGQ